jgi:hypothetical protein
MFSELQTVWHEFEVLADALKANVDSPKYFTPDVFKSKAMLWVKCFKKAFDEVSKSEHIIRTNYFDCKLLDRLDHGDDGHDTAC